MSLKIDILFFFLFLFLPFFFFSVRNFATCKYVIYIERAVVWMIFYFYFLFSPWGTTNERSQMIRRSSNRLFLNLLHCLRERLWVKLSSVSEFASLDLGFADQRFFFFLVWPKSINLGYLSDTLPCRRCTLLVGSFADIPWAILYYALGVLFGACLIKTLLMLMTKIE